MSVYDSSSISVLDGIEHIRTRPGMYLSSTEFATRLCNEVLDNSIDEAIGNHCDKILVKINNNDKTFTVIDSGRGIPICSEKTSEEDDPVLKIFRNIFSSGKFKKGTNQTYAIGIGLHGIGLSAVYALSEWVKVEIYRDNKHAIYELKNDNTYERKIEKFPSKDRPFSTKITCKPDKKYFKDVSIEVDKIEESLILTTVQCENLKAILSVDGNKKIIHGKVEEIYENYLVKDWQNEKWFNLSYKNKSDENYRIDFCWTEDNNSNKVFSTINVTPCHEGYHILSFNNILKDFFIKKAKKYKYEFQPNDVLVRLKVYMSLNILNPEFGQQTKNKLTNNSDISVMTDSLENQLEKLFKSDEENIINILESIQDYRKSIDNKKIIKDSSGKNKRGSTKFTKLRDCVDSGGEIVLIEGESAGSGLLKLRNPRKTAVLPLRGVVLNSITKGDSDLMKNREINEIIRAFGCGIYPNCDIDNFRYSKVLLAADQDPAGNFITSLLIMLFLHKMPEIVKHEKVFICQTPLYGVYENKKFIPLWTENDINKYKHLKIHRYKGIGEHSDEEIKTLMLDEKTRKLTQVIFPKDKKDLDLLFKLFSSTEERRKLALGIWNPEEIIKECTDEPK